MTSLLAGLDFYCYLYPSQGAETPGDPAAARQQAGWRSEAETRNNINK
ncbi:hypothetical protein SAMN04487825_12013 [Prevotella sp. kh1p2]|nr:hypothetical protein SAMN04487825_12013 [Prevotella sp. kh1p2]SNU12270.1 hypothetical protein SAMN06298210_12131 [Prevotellaceae bacterium KH2P17]